MDRTPFDFDDLHPEARTQFRELTARLRAGWMKGETEHLLYPFEGFRPGARQDYLLTQGTTRARAYTGPHWYGLAVDFVPDRAAVYGIEVPLRARPFWPNANDKIWRYLGETAASVGLVQPISWDKPHIEHPTWAQARKAMRSF